MKPTYSDHESRLRAALQRELGPIVSQGLDDQDVVEILFNPDGRCWFDRHSTGLEVVGELDRSQVEALTASIATHFGKVFNDESPVLEARLPFHGARFTAVRPPIADAVLFSLRKRSRTYRLEEDFVATGIISRESASLLVEALRSRANLIICGGLGTGKTALANALLLAADSRLRILVLEDTPEISCEELHAVPLQTSLTHDLASLVRTTLRLRADSVCIGELRGTETPALLTAWNSGIRGGLATLHANDSASALSKLELLVRLAGVHLHDIARELIAAAVGYVVLIEGRGQQRRVAEILQIQGYDAASGRYRLDYHLKQECDR